MSLQNLLQILLLARISAKVGLALQHPVFVVEIVEGGGAGGRFPSDVTVQEADIVAVHVPDSHIQALVIAARRAVVVGVAAVIVAGKIQPAVDIGYFRR